jgi:hypothetical protein
MRLVHRDKGCVVCHAMGTDSIYQYRDDLVFFTYSLPPCSHWSVRFETSWSIQVHVIILKWARRGYQNLIMDPFTAENAIRNKRDPLRINSLKMEWYFAYSTTRLITFPYTTRYSLGLF